MRKFSLLSINFTEQSPAFLCFQLLSDCWQQINMFIPHVRVDETRQQTDNFVMTTVLARVMGMKNVAT